MWCNFSNVTHQTLAQVPLCAHSNGAISAFLLWGLWSSPADWACPTAFFRPILPSPEWQWCVWWKGEISLLYFAHIHSLPPFSHPLKVSVCDVSFSPLWKIHLFCTAQPMEQIDPSKDNSIFLRILNVQSTKTASNKNQHFIFSSVIPLSCMKDCMVLTPKY